MSVGGDLFFTRCSLCRLTSEQVNTVKVFAEVLLWDVEICRRTVLDKKWCKDQTLDLPTLMCSIRLAPVYPGRTKHYTAT